MKKESASDRVNLSVRQLHCYSLADALESLEQQINNTLLRLVLEVSIVLESLKICVPKAVLLIN